MAIEETTEKRFEQDIESFLVSPAGGYTKGTAPYDAELGLYVDTLMAFIQETQVIFWGTTWDSSSQISRTLFSSMPIFTITVPT